MTGDTRQGLTEAVEAARISLMRADECMTPGAARVGPAMANVVNAVERLTDAVEVLSRAQEAGR